MRRITAPTALQVASCVSCAVVAWIFEGSFGASEFSGGSVTGPLLKAFDASLLFFSVAAILTFVWPRLAAALAMIAVLLAVPLYAYVTAPGPFRALVGGLYSVSNQSTLQWDPLAITGIAITVVTFGICLRVLISRDRVRSQQPRG